MQRNPDEMLGDLLVLIEVRGDAIDEFEGNPVNEFFDAASPKLCASVLSHLGWKLGKGGDPSPEIVLRCTELWERAVERNDDWVVKASISAWASSGCLDVEWWMPRLLDASEAGEVEGLFSLGPEIVDAARGGMLGPALELVERLLAGSNPWLLERTAIPVIAWGLDSHDEEVRKKAGRVMNAFGERGHIAIRSAIDEFRTGGSR